MEKSVFLVVNDDKLLLGHFVPNHNGTSCFAIAPDKYYEKDCLSYKQFVKKHQITLKKFKRFVGIYVQKNVINHPNAKGFNTSSVSFNEKLLDRYKEEASQDLINESYLYYH